MPRPRAIFYIDGFNLYNGLRRRAEANGLEASEHRWLDLSKLADFLMPEAEVVLVRYFTSRVKRRIDNPEAGQRQEVFLRALADGAKLDVPVGHFQRNKVTRRLVEDPSRAVRVIDFKEKGSDANLAAYLVHDALSNTCERAGVMSSDSDLVEPIRLAREALAHGVVVFGPNAGESNRALQNVATEARPRQRSGFPRVPPPSHSQGQERGDKPPEW